MFEPRRRRFRLSLAKDPEPAAPAPGEADAAEGGGGDAPMEEPTEEEEEEEEVVVPRSAKRRRRAVVEDDDEEEAGGDCARGEVFELDDASSDVELVELERPTRRRSPVPVPSALQHAPLKVRRAERSDLGGLGGVRQHTPLLATRVSAGGSPSPSPSPLRTARVLAKSPSPLRTTRGPVAGSLSLSPSPLRTARMPAKSPSPLVQSPLDKYLARTGPSSKRPRGSLDRFVQSSREEILDDEDDDDDEVEDEVFDDVVEVEEPEPEPEPDPQPEADKYSYCFVPVSKLRAQGNPLFAPSKAEEKRQARAEEKTKKLLADLSAAAGSGKTGTVRAGTVRGRRKSTNQWVTLPDGSKAYINHRGEQLQGRAAGAVYASRRRGRGGRGRGRSRGRGKRAK